MDKLGLQAETDLRTILDSGPLKMRQIIARLLRLMASQAVDDRRGRRRGKTAPRKVNHYDVAG